MRKGLLLLSFFTVFLFLVSCVKHTHSISNEWNSDEYYHWHICEDETCQDVFEKTEHSWDEGVITTEPTELAEGVKTYTCSVCSKTKTEILAVLDHTHTFSDQYSYDEVFHWFASTCEHEGEVKSKELHDYKFEQQSPSTCTEEQVLIGTCVCGDTTIKVGEPANGHKISNFQSNNDATCTADGTKTGKCDVCNEILTYTDEGSILGHNWIEYTTEPTYESSGEVYKECNRDGCDARETLEVLPKLIPVSDIEISGKLHMGINTTQTLVGNITPADAHDKTLIWESSDEEVATVDENGNVTALKLGIVTITATSHNGLTETFKISVIETAIDSEIDSFYDNVVEYSGQRTGPIVTHDTFIKLGEKGIYVYQLVTDAAGETTKSHVELYFTLSNETILENSLSVHLYYEGKDNIRTYSYDSITNVVRNKDLEEYCEYSIELVSNENGLATFEYELFVDYSYFGLTEAPEFISTQIRAVSGKGNPLTNATAGSLDYKDILNYEMYGEGGFIIKKITPETEIDSVKDEFYDGVVQFSGKRTGPVVTHESYIKLGEKGISVYQLVTDGATDSSSAHIELYFTLGEKIVFDNSLSIHVYYKNSEIKSYTYNSSSNVAMNNKLAEKYCAYSVVLVSNDGGIATYAYELYVDYSYFGLEEAPKSINAQVRTVSGKGNPLTNAYTGALDYKDIANYEKYGEKGYIAEIIVDGAKDDKYDELNPLIVDKGTVRNDLGHETYVYFGKKGFYVYHIVVDSTALVDAKTHVELYFQLGNSTVLDNSLGVHLYPGGTDNLRTYTYSSSSNVSRNNDLKKYCTYSIELLSNSDGLSTYGYELLVDYSYFGLTKAPDSLKIQVRSTSYQGGQLTNADKSGGLDYKLIENYLTFDKNGYTTEVEEPLEYEIDGEKGTDYNVIPLIGKRSEPNVTQESYVYLGKKGIYIYQLVMDGSGKSENAHIEWYLTLGDNDVLADSLAIHLYYEKTPYIRSYTYSSTVSVDRNDDIAAEYCKYVFKKLSESNGVVTYGYELFIDYKYFNLDAAPEFINAQVRAISGANNPLTNSTKAGTLDYKLIENYHTFDKFGLVYDSVGTKDLELDPSHIVSGNYEMEFSLQTINALNKLSGVTFTGVGSEYITELGNGKYKISVPADKIADFAENQIITVVDTRNLGKTFNVRILNEIKTKYKILMIGNSYADDTIQWVHEICEDLGIEFTIANMFIGGCTLAMHLTNLNEDAAKYTYAEYDSISKTWIRHENTSISQALSYDDWNYVSLQQASARSGIADSYDDIDRIIDAVLKLKDDVKFIWNMTWAYTQAQDPEQLHSSFGNYDNNQETMYNAIVNAVTTKVLTNDRIVAVSPAGTAIQNARTSFVGDNLTRDKSCHLSYDLGRFIAGLSMVGTMTGADLTKVKFFPELEDTPKLDDKYRDMAIEAVMNAIENPLVVTQSTYVE